MSVHYFIVFHSPQLLEVVVLNHKLSFDMQKALLSITTTLLLPDLFLLLRTNILQNNIIVSEPLMQGY